MKDQLIDYRTTETCPICSIGWKIPGLDGGLCDSHGWVTSCKSCLKMGRSFDESGNCLECKSAIERQKKTRR